MILIFYLFFLWYTLRFFEKIAGPFNIILLFTIFHLTYTLMIPLELYFFQIGRFSNLGLDMNDYFFWSLISYFGFISPFYFFKSHIIFQLDNIVLTDARVRKANLFLFFLLLFGFIIFKDSILSVDTYENNIKMSSNPVYKFFINLSILFSSILIALNFMKRSYLIVFVLVIILFTWSLYSSDKNPVVIGGLGFLYGLNKVNNKTNRSFIYLLLILTVIPVFSVAFSSYRSGNISYFEFSRSLYSNSDPKGPFETIINTASNKSQINYIPGESYLKSFITWVPQKIWSDRPDDLAVVYAKSNLSNYYKGLGLGFSPIAEGLLNFGYYGPFFHYLLTALSLLFLIIFFKKINTIKLNHLLLYFFISYYVIMMHRSPFSFIADIIRVLIPVILFFNLIRLTFNHESTSHLSNK